MVDLRRSLYREQLSEVIQDWVVRFPANQGMNVLSGLFVRQVPGHKLSADF